MGKKRPFIDENAQTIVKQTFFSKALDRQCVNPYYPLPQRREAPVAQLDRAPPPPEAEVSGSNPVGRAIKSVLRVTVKSVVVEVVR